MRKIGFLLLGLLAVGQGQAQKNAHNGIFFEISGNGLKHPSYILGSNHEVSGSFVHQIPQFDEIYNKVRQTCFETEMGTEADQTTAQASQAVASLQQQQQQTDMAKLLLLPQDSTYARLIGADKAAEIDRIMSGLFPSYVSDMRPNYAATILQAVMQARQLSLTGVGSPFVSIDYFVHALSTHDKKRVAWLEPRSLQDSIIARMHGAGTAKSQTLRDQMMQFYLMCKTAHARIDNSLYNKVLYMRGQGLASVDNLVKSSDELRRMTKTIMPDYDADAATNLMAVKERNALWMKKIPQLMKAEPTLFVVGIAHLYPYRGSKGLLADLKKKGYTIRQLEAPTPQLTVKVADEEMKKGMFVFKLANGEGEEGELAQLLFDQNNNATYSGVTNDRFNQAYIFIGNQEFSCFLKKGKSLTATFNKVGDKYQVTYGGDPDMVQASNAMYQYRNSYSYPVYFARTDTDPAAKTTYKEKLAALDKAFAEVNAQGMKIQDEGMRNQLLLDNRCEYLRFRLSVMRMEMNKQHVDISKDAEYQKYLEMIDVNNPYYDRFNLISNYVTGKIPQDCREKGLSYYGIEAMRAIQTYVKDRKTRLQLQSNIAQEVLTEENKDIDTFWNAFKEFGDADVVKALETKVNALKNTESGMKAPVCEFNDINGKTHKSSDFEGKVLYIDFWATWCGPCKQEIPHMAKLYDHYKNNPKIAIISISIDTNVEAWRKMVTKDKPEWPQFVAEGAQNMKMSNDWGITAIPRFIILNADGTIRSANATRPSSPNIIQELDAIIAEQKQ
ncbi:MAG: TraB/GumN family protein [Prevotella sp.]|nr:TraB/GumN family protein [Prevotella sp.]MDY4038209.1 TraB/GumN family protein [Prevotella sp.]